MKWRSNSANEELIEQFDKRNKARKLGKDSKFVFWIRFNYRFSEYYIKYKSAEVSEPQFHRQFKTWIEGGDTNWKNLTERTFNALTSEQQAYFRRLAAKLINCVDTDIGADKFYGTREGIWSIVIWLSFCSTYPNWICRPTILLSLLCLIFASDIKVWVIWVWATKHVGLNSCVHLRNRWLFSEVILSERSEQNKISFIKCAS